MSIKALCLFSFFSIFTLFIANAQDDPGPGSVTVFSEDGENFTLYLNGEQKNGSPASRVVVENVTEVPVSFRIVFQGGTIPELKKNGFRQGANCLFSILKNKKGERVLRVKDCSGEAIAGGGQALSSDDVAEATPAPTSNPEQLSATYAGGVITINDGRTLTVKKIKANGMTYPQVIMTALQGAKVSITYDDNKEQYSAEPPLKYQVKDFSNNNAYFTLTVDEGGPKKTWKVKLQNSNGYDLHIE